jgi:hypothetical protein
LRPAQANSLQDLFSNIARAKWTGGVTQVLESLLCKCKTLGSNSSPAKKKERRKEKNPKNQGSYFLSFSNTEITPSGLRAE